MTNHETGATFEYHGQRVLFEWQSLHERSRIAATGGVTCNRALIVCDSSVAGLVFAGRANCASTKTPAPTIKIHRKIRNSLVFIFGRGLTRMDTDQIKNNKVKSIFRFARIRVYPRLIPVANGRCNSSSSARS